MNAKYPLITKLIIAAILGILAIVIPYAVLKVLFVLAGIVIFATTLKKFAWLLITLSVVFIVLPVVVLSAIGMLQPPFWNIPNYFGPGSEQFFDNTFTTGRGSYSSNTAKTLHPDTYVSVEDYLYFDGLAFEVEFDPESERIHIPDELEVNEIHGILRIELPENYINTKAVVTIGTKQSFKEIEFDSVFVDMKGYVHTNKFVVDGTSIKISGDINAEELITIRSTSINAKGNLNSSNVQIDGTSVNIEGNIFSENIRINGTSVDLDVETELAEQISLRGTSVTGIIKYIDDWSGSRNFSVNASRGDLDIWIPESSGTLSINKSGVVSITERRY
jgi:cytoskeletal protein CcmA (bactofilin family)